MESDKYKVLALKYRPKHFFELIAQDVMVETITNSIKLDKLPNAYLLTGIHGVGKTTTARLIAQAINCKKDFIKGEECNKGEYCCCKEIRDFKMLDCLEIDAASKTGIDSIRELIDSSQYAPTSAKYKVIILDEVQMLSKSAFNGLLKTLEEPPPHLKFIFATTEVKKIPLTIVSRCQRFDLHRVPIKDLLAHLKKVSKIENGKISEEALTLIAKAAKGSIRDSLSLLERALLINSIKEKGVLESSEIRKMLGLADRSKILQLLKFILQGDQKKSIDSIRQMIDEGIEAANLKNDILELIYFILQKKNLGDFESDLTISESELEMIDSISKDVSVSTLILFWQFTLKALDEDKLLTNPLLGLEMLVFRLLHLKEIPSFEDFVNKSISNQTYEITTEEKVKKKFLNEENEITKISKDQIKNTTQTKPELTSSSPKNTSNESIKSFEDLIKLSSKKKEIELKFDLERNVNLIKFSEGKIDISFNENLGKNFVKNLSEKLLQWTGKRWLITLAKGLGKKTFSELQLTKRKELLEQEKRGEVYKKFKNIFSDAELIEISKKE